MLVPPPRTPRRTPTNAELRRQITNRGWRALNYLSINALTLVVFGSTVLADYLLFSLIWWLMGSDIEKYPLIARGAEFVQIAVGLMALLGTIVHGALSTWGQIKLDWELAHEGEGHE